MEKKKKKFSIFCCFSTNDAAKRKRKEKQQFFTGNKTNITDQNSSIKVSDFNEYEESQKLEKREKFVINSYMDKGNNNFLQRSRKSESNIFYKKNSIENYNLTNSNFKGIINDNINISNYNNQNKTIEDKNSNYKLSVIDDYKKSITLNKNNDKLNLSKIKIDNPLKLLITDKEEFINKEKIFSNKEERYLNIITNKEEIREKEENEKVNMNSIQLKRYKTNTIDNNINKNNNELYSYNTSNINIYDNNYCPIIKDKKVNQIRENKIQKKKIKNKFKNLFINYSINDTKNSHKISNKDINNDKNLNSNKNKFLINSAYKETLNKNKYNNIQKMRIKFYFNTKKDKNRSLSINNTNIIDSFLFFPSKFKFSKSELLIKKINMDNIESLILRNKMKKNMIKSKDKNIIIENLNINDKKKKKSENYKTIEKENISNLSPINTKKNRTSMKKKFNKLPLTPIGKKLLLMNDSSFIIKNSKSNDIYQSYFEISQNLQEKENINNLSNKSTLSKTQNLNQNNENNKIINISGNKEEIKDRDLDIEEEKEVSENKNINDSKSIVSNNIISPLMNSQSRDIFSYGASINSKNTFKDSNLNINDLSNSKERFFIPHGKNDTEIEIINENGKEFKSFIETPRASGNFNKRLSHKNIIYNSGNKKCINNNYNNNYGYNKSFSTQISLEMKNIWDKINYKSKEIKIINEKIKELDNNIQKCEEINKKYQLWIEKEENENEILMNLLNYLNNYMK